MAAVPVQPVAISLATGLGRLPAWQQLGSSLSQLGLGRPQPPSSSCGGTQARNACAQPPGGRLSPGCRGLPSASARPDRACAQRCPQSLPAAPAAGRRRLLLLRAAVAAVLAPPLCILGHAAGPRRCRLLLLRGAAVAAVLAHPCAAQEGRQQPPPAARQQQPSSHSRPVPAAITAGLAKGVAAQMARGLVREEAKW
jgi:hypothetical protein